MQSDRSRLRELEIRVANPQHWSSGEHQINVENLRQLRFQIEDQLKKLRQTTSHPLDQTARSDQLASGSARARLRMKSQASSAESEK